MGFSRGIIWAALLYTSVATAQPSGTHVADTSDVLMVVEKMSEFPGGPSAWRNFLQNNLRANIPFWEMGAPAGRYNVQVRFIVDKEGKTSNITPLTNYGYGFEAEVVRVIGASGTWRPAEQKGKLVKSYYQQPVVFMSPADKFTIETAPPLPQYTLLANADNRVNVKSFFYKKENISLVADSGSVSTVAAGQFIIRVPKPGGTWIKVMVKDSAAPVELIHFEVLAQAAAPATPAPTEKKTSAAPTFTWLTWEAALAAQQKNPLPISLFAYSPGKNDALITEAEQLIFNGDGGSYVMEKSYPVRFQINGTDTIQHEGKTYINSQAGKRHPFSKWLDVKEGGPYVIVVDTQGKIRNRLDCSKESPVTVFGALTIVLSLLGKQ